MRLLLGTCLAGTCIVLITICWLDRLIEVSNQTFFNHLESLNAQNSGSNFFMTASLEDLANRLESTDRDTQALALGELIAQGKLAVPVLTHALGSENDYTRALAAEGLAQIADPASADSLVAALDDPSDRVRAYAATGLSNMGDPRAIDALVRTINDYPDRLHSYYSLSTYALMNQGAEALPVVAPLLKSPDLQTRRRAFLAVRSIITQRILSESETWESLWESLERYEPDAPEAQRNQAADRWINWIQQHQ